MNSNPEPQPGRKGGNLAFSTVATLLVLITIFLVYLGHQLGPGKLEAAVFGGVFLLIAGIAFLRFPHFTLMFAGLLFLLQDLLSRLLENSSPLAGQLFKHSDEVLIALFFLLTVGRIISRKLPVYRTHVEVPLIGFILVSIFGSRIAEVPAGIYLIQLFLYLKGFLLFFVLINLEIDCRTARRYGRFFFRTGLIILAIGLVDLFNPLWFRNLTGNDPFIEIRYGIPSVKAIFTHPGVFGWFAAFLALYSFGFYMTFGRKSYLWLGLIFSGGSFLSMRRRNLAGIAAGLTGGLLQQPLAKKIRYGLILGAIACVFIVLAWPKVTALYHDLAQVYLTAENPSEEARNVLYITSIAIAKERFPWGVGLGRFGSWMSQIHYSPVYRQYKLSGVYGLSPDNPKYITDTFWPAILGETGLAGVFFYLWICARLFYLLYRRTRRATDPFVKAIMLGTLMVFIESFVESMATAAFTAPPLAYFVFGSLGLAFSLSRSESE